MTDTDRYIESWRMKKIYQRLRDYRGNGTSMISLIAPPETQISQLSRLLTDEQGTASNIKSRVNRLSVLDAITSAQQRLKLYNRVPPNGLLLFCGTITTDEGKEKRVTIDIEPHKPINTSLYKCDNKFHCEAICELIDNEDTYGFIVMNGDSCLYGTLQGNTRSVMYQFSVDLPKKHGRGGQSANRFARLRLEARHNYVKKVSEFATQIFISDNKCNVKGIILAGSADFKSELNKADFFDPRLQKQVIQMVDIAYGGLSGFNQAIHLTADSMGNVRFTQERKVLQTFFTEIDTDSGKYAFGIKDVLTALEMGAVETFIVWENNQEEVSILVHKSNKTQKIHFGKLSPEPEYEVSTIIPFVEWVAENYKNYGTTLEFVSDNSPEGTQFAKGFSGIGGILRWKIDFEEHEIAEFSDEED